MGEREVEQKEEKVEALDSACTVMEGAVGLELS